MHQWSKHAEGDVDIPQSTILYGTWFGSNVGFPLQRGAPFHSAEGASLAGAAGFFWHANLAKNESSFIWPFGAAAEEAVLIPALGEAAVAESVRCGVGAEGLAVLLPATAAIEGVPEATVGTEAAGFDATVELEVATPE